MTRKVLAPVSLNSVAVPLFESEIPPMIFPDDSARVRASDPVTSHEAADSNDVAESQLQVLATLAKVGPLADHEIHEWLTHVGILFSPSRVRTARHELLEAGLVEDTGMFHLTPARRRTKVWGLTAEGFARYAREFQQ